MPKTAHPDPTRVEGPSCLQSWQWKHRYSSGRDELVAAFYRPALQRASRYDRAVGYFRSSFYSLTGQAVAAFALKGGQIRLLCAPELSREDVATLRESPGEVSTVLRQAAARELAEIASRPEAAEGCRTLAALLRYGALDIRFAIPEDAAGIFHDKLGVFRDPCGHTVSFTGSANETWSAWHPQGNHESFEVFTSWSPDADRVTEHRAFFDLIWHGEEPSLTVAPAREAFEQGLVAIAQDEDPAAVLAALRDRTSATRLLPHQVAALDAWVSAGGRGILKHATGSGKTITALAAARRHLTSGHLVLVVVPSVLLLEQWCQVLQDELADLSPAVLRVGGGHDSWRRSGDLTAFLETDATHPRIIVAVAASASGQAFLDRPWNDAGDFLLIADEVHRLGSTQYREILTLPAQYRLGLSATPERYRDPTGTALILEYFGGIVPPVFSLVDAIRAGRLCPYEYHVHVTQLDNDEIDQWNDFSRRIARLMGGASSGTGDLSPALEMLLIQRSRIAKQAAGKPTLAVNILGNRYRPGERWLVYCDDRTQLQTVRQGLTNRGLHSFEYWSAMHSHGPDVLARFSRSGGILVAIRCLDEGIDIPSVSHALILASSQNPREFIQRRGRVLRVSPGKDIAVIHDVLVSPPSVNGASFRNLALAEIRRAHEFAQHAENLSAALMLDAFAAEWGVNWDDVVDDGVEADPLEEEEVESGSGV